MNYSNGWIIRYKRGWNSEIQLLRNTKESFELKLKELENDRKVSMIVWYKVKYLIKL